MAQDDVNRARTQLTQAHEVYIPSLTAGAGLGPAYGYSPYPPTLFTLSSGSLVYNASQFYYIRSAHAGVDAAQLALQDVRETVAEDAALTFVALDHDQQREQVIRQQADYANTLVQIVQERFDAGQDTQLSLTQAKLTASQFRLAILHAQDDTANDRDYLARLTGLPADTVKADSAFPAAIPSLTSDAAPGAPANAAIASAFANAEAKRQQALGDARFRYRPQINLFAQYNRYATFTDSFKSLNTLYNNNLTANEAVIGVQISIPIVDKLKQAKGRETAADASHALHEAQNAQITALDGQSRLRHSITELEAQGEVAALQQQVAQQQLDILRLQLQAGNPDGPQMTPKDEQNALIAERDKYLGVLDATFQLRQAEIRLIRQMGELETWLKSSASAPSLALPAAPAHP
jgi:outer membrane protein TolC